MRLIRLYIENFGKLSGRRFDFNAGMTAIVEDNGFGKSTLAYFIKAMLYGLSDTKKQSLLENERKRFLPWSGGVCGGYAVISYEGCEYRIERTFGKRAALDTVRITEEKTGKETDRFGTSVGETIYGIDAEGFLRTAFFAEREFEEKIENESIEDRLSGLVGSGGDVSGAEAALSLLDSQRKFYTKRGGGGELSAVEDEISRIRAELSLLEKCRDERCAQIQNYEQLTKALQTEKKDGKQKHSRGKTVKRTIGVGLLLFGAAALLLLLWQMPMLSPLALLSLAPGFALLFARERRSEDSSHAIQKREELIAEHARLDATIRALDERLDVLPLREAELHTLTERRDSYRKKLNTVNLAEAFLRRAKDAMASKYLGGTKEAFVHYASLFTGETDANYAVSQSFEIEKEAHGARRPSEAFSRGERELFAIASRFALISALYQKQMPPLILDDPFVNLDDGRIRRVLDYLNTLGKETQILYFTCSKSRT